MHEHVPGATMVLTRIEEAEVVAMMKAPTLPL